MENSSSTREAGPASGQEVRILRALRRILHAVEIHSRKLTATYRLTTPQLLCLLAIREEGPLTPTAIANRVVLSPSTVVGILDRLEEKGWVRRERGTRDRRLVHVSLTEEGRRLADRAPSPLQGRFAEALRALPEAERTAIARSLERVVDLMEAGHLAVAPILESRPIDEDPPVAS
jgi:DNA-binding MarR family transcriptional regulator